MNDVEREVHRAVAAYSDALNHRDWNTLQAVFCEDASWRTTNKNIFEFSGAAAIAEGLKAIIEPFDMLVQIPGPTVVSVAGETIHARSTVQEFVRYTGGSIHVLGSYADLLRIEGGQLRFASRVFTAFYWADDTLTGEGLQRAELARR